MSKKNITIAGLDGLDIFKKRIIKKFNNKNHPNYNLTSCKANIESLFDLDELTTITNSCLSSFNNQFANADILFFSKGNNSAINIEYDFEKTSVSSAKLVIFCCKNSDDLLKISNVDLIKSFPNAVIAGFVFNRNGHKSLTKFINEGDFYDKLSKGNLLGSEIFKKLCQMSVSSSYFYSYKADIDFTQKENYTAEISKYASYERILQNLVNQSTAYANSSLFVGAILSESFKSHEKSAEFESIMPWIKSEYSTYIKRLNKKDVRSILSDTLPVISISDVRPGDIMLTKDNDVKNQYFRIVTSVNNSTIEAVGYPDKSKIKINTLSTGNNMEVGKSTIINCLKSASKYSFSMDNGNTHTYVSATMSSDKTPISAAIELNDVTDYKVNKVFYFVRPLLFKNIYETSSYDPSYVPAPVVNTSTNSIAHKAEVEKFFKNDLKNLSDYEFIKYINNTALNQHDKDKEEIGLFDEIGYHLSNGYWKVIEERITPVNKSLDLSSEVVNDLYYKKVSEGHIDGAKELHKIVFGNEYDKKKIDKANEMFGIYLMSYRLKKISEKIDKDLSELYDSIDVKTTNVKNDNNHYISKQQEHEKKNHEKLLNLLQNIFGVDAQRYNSFEDNDLKKILYNYKIMISFISKCLPDIEHLTTYHSIDAFGFDFATSIKYEEILFENAKKIGEVIKESLITIIGFCTGPLAATVSKGASATIILAKQAAFDSVASALFDTAELIHKAHVSKKELEYGKEIADILINALLAGGSSFGLGKIANKVEGALNGRVKLNSQKLKEVENEGKDFLGQVFKDLDKFDSQVVDLIELLKKDDKSIELLEKRIIKMQNDLSLNDEILKRCDKRLRNADYKIIREACDGNGISLKDISFDVNGVNGNYFDFLSDEIYIAELENEMKKYLKNTSFDTNGRGIVEKTRFVFGKKKEELQKLINEHHTNIEWLKLRKDINFNDIEDLISKSETSVKKINDYMSKVLERADFQYDPITMNKESLIKMIEDKTKGKVNALRISIEKIENARNTVEALFTVLGATLYNTLSTAFLPKFAEKKEENSEIQIEDVISSNVNFMLQAVFDDEKINDLRDEYKKYKLSEENIQSLISSIKNNPFTYIQKTETINTITKKTSVSKVIKSAPYSDKVKELAKKITLCTDYSKLNHQQVQSYEYLASLISNRLKDEYFDEIESKDKRMREENQDLADFMEHYSTHETIQIFGKF